MSGKKDQRQKCCAGEPHCANKKPGQVQAPKPLVFIRCPEEGCKKVCCANSGKCYEQLVHHFVQEHCQQLERASAAEHHSNALALQEHFAPNGSLAEALANRLLVEGLPDIVAEDKDLYNKNCSSCKCMLGGFGFSRALMHDSNCQDFLCYPCALKAKPGIQLTTAEGCVRLWSTFEVQVSKVKMCLQQATMQPEGAKVDALKVNVVEQLGDEATNKQPCINKPTNYKGGTKTHSPEH
eukprot:gene9199-9366_t